MQYSPLYGTERVTRLVLRASDYRVQRPFYPYKDELQRQCGSLGEYFFFLSWESKPGRLVGSQLSSQTWVSLQQNSEVLYTTLHYIKLTNSESEMRHHVTQSDSHTVKPHYQS